MYFSSIDWTNTDFAITEHFSVGEALTLHAWNRLANENDGTTDTVKQNIYDLCTKLEAVRNILNSPILVHCIFRSVDYNKTILHSLPNDVHAMGMAIDFDCGQDLSIDQIKNILAPQLEQLELRMERDTTTWVHLDIHSPGASGRYFTA